MFKLTRHSVFLFLCLLLVQTPAESATVKAQSCGYNVKPKTGRNLGLDILSTLPNGSYNENLQQLLALKGSFQTFTLEWSAIETAPGVFQDPGSFMELMNGVATTSNTKISFVLRPIDTTGKTVPADLQNRNFNDPVMIARFKKMLDFTLSKIPPKNLTAVFIGNEIDTYNPGQDENFWVEYAQFLNAIKTYANTRYPQLPIGFVATFNGITNSTQKTPDGWPAKQVMKTLAEKVNVVGVTYYPLNSDFSVKTPLSPRTDIPALIQSLPAYVPIHMVEVGYQTSAVNKSNYAMQSKFICEFMHQWDRYIKRIPNVAFLRLNDITEEEARILAGGYNSADPAFLEYLRTLGLFNVDGTAKPGHTMLKYELIKRQF